MIDTMCSSIMLWFNFNLSLQNQQQPDCISYCTSIYKVNFWCILYHAVFHICFIFGIWYWTEMFTAKEQHCHLHMVFNSSTDVIHKNMYWVWSNSKLSKTADKCNIYYRVFKSLVESKHFPNYMVVIMIFFAITTCH